MPICIHRTQICRLCACPTNGKLKHFEPVLAQKTVPETVQKVHGKKLALFEHHWHVLQSQQQRNLHKHDKAPQENDRVSLCTQLRIYDCIFTSCTWMHTIQSMTLASCRSK